MVGNVESNIMTKLLEQIGWRCCQSKRGLILLKQWLIGIVKAMGAQGIGQVWLAKSHRSTHCRCSSYVRNAEVIGYCTVHDDRM